MKTNFFNLAILTFGTKGLVVIPLVLLGFTACEVEEPIPTYTLTTTSSPVEVILTIPFWTNLGVNQNFLALSEKNRWPIVQLHDLGLANENMALERFENISVGRHPGDLGMERIATRIWTVLANEL